MVSIYSQIRYKNAVFFTAMILIFPISNAICAEISVIPKLDVKRYCLNMVNDVDYQNAYNPNRASHQSDLFRECIAREQASYDELKNIVKSMQKTQNAYNCTKISASQMGERIKSAYQDMARVCGLTLILENNHRDLDKAFNESEFNY